MFLTGQQVGYSLRGEGFRLGGLAFGFGLLCCLPFPFCGLCLAELCIRRRLLRESIPLYVGLAGAFGRGQCLSLAFFDAPPLVGDAGGFGFPGLLCGDLGGFNLAFFARGIRLRGCDAGLLCLGTGLDGRKAFFLPLRLECEVSRNDPGHPLPRGLCHRRLVCRRL